MNIDRHAVPQIVIPAKAGIHGPEKNLDSRPRFHEGRLFAGVTVLFFMVLN